MRGEINVRATKLADPAKHETITFIEILESGEHMGDAEGVGNQNITWATTTTTCSLTNQSKQHWLLIHISLSFIMNSGDFSKDHRPWEGSHGRD